MFFPFCARLLYFYNFHVFHVYVLLFRLNWSQALFWFHLCFTLCVRVCEMHVKITHISVVYRQTRVGKQLCFIVLNGGSDHKALILYPTRNSLLFCIKSADQRTLLRLRVERPTCRTPLLILPLPAPHDLLFIVPLFLRNPSHLYFVVLSSPSRTHAFLHNVFLFLLDLSADRVVKKQFFFF